MTTQLWWANNGLLHSERSVDGSALKLIRKELKYWRNSIKRTMWTQHQSLKSVFLMQLKNHGSSSPHPAQERFTAEWKWWMQSRILCRPLQQIPPTAQNCVELSPLLDQHSYSWECNWDFLEWTCKDSTILFFTTIKSHVSDTPADVILFFLSFFSLNVCTHGHETVPGSQKEQREWNWNTIKKS